MIYQLENRPAQDYGPFYNVLRSHRAVDDFMSEFHRLGCGKPRYKDKDYLKIRDLYAFWRERGFLTQKQIHYAITLIERFQR